MNIALLLAGGSGKRTEQDVPKQFFSVFEKPVIIHTMWAFQKHPDIDKIVVSCLKGWEDILQAYAREEKINKLCHIVTGGENGQDSARIGLESMKEICSDKDIVIIHDAVRPMVSQDIISDCIATCREYGSGLAAMRCHETIMESIDGICGKTGVSRSSIMRVQTPQAYYFGKVLQIHEDAVRQGITNSVYTNTLMMEFGETLYFSKGSEKNLKITTMEDVEIFKALYKVRKEEWVK